MSIRSYGHCRYIHVIQANSFFPPDSREALKVLEESIEFASKILSIDTTDVEPLYHVHTEQYLELRDDVELEGNIAEQLLENAPLTEEEYFVSPPGNVELEAEEKDF